MNVNNNRHDQWDIPARAVESIYSAVHHKVITSICFLLKTKKTI